MTLMRASAMPSTKDARVRLAACERRRTARGSERAAEGSSAGAAPRSERFADNGALSAAGAARCATPLARAADAVAPADASRICTGGEGWDQVKDQVI